MEDFFARHSRRSSGTLWSCRRFWCSRHWRGLSFSFYQRLKVKSRTISVVRGKGTQPIERRLRLGGQPSNIGLLSIRKALSILGEDGLNPRFDFGLAFRRKLGQVWGLLRRKRRGSRLRAEKLRGNQRRGRRGEGGTARKFTARNRRIALVAHRKSPLE